MFVSRMTSTDANISTNIEGKTCMPETLNAVLSNRLSMESYLDRYKTTSADNVIDNAADEDDEGSSEDETDSGDDDDDEDDDEEEEEEDDGEEDEDEEIGNNSDEEAEEDGDYGPDNYMGPDVDDGSAPYPPLEDVNFDPDFEYKTPTDEMLGENYQTAGFSNIPPGNEMDFDGQGTSYMADNNNTYDEGDDEYDYENENEAMNPENEIDQFGDNYNEYLPQNSTASSVGDSQPIVSTTESAAVGLKEKEGGSEKKIKKRKRKKIPKSENDTEPKKKKKRVKKPKKKDSESDEDGAKKEKASKDIRKNIRDIMNEQELDVNTLAAQNEELERKKRLLELKRNLQTQSPLSLHVPAPPVPKKEEKDQQLKSLLEAAEEEAEKNDEIIFLKQENKEKNSQKGSEVVIDISSDDDDVVVTKDEGDEVEEEDPNNAGSHVNDHQNCANEQGQILVNVAHPSEDPDVFLSTLIAKYIKPHQIGGIRFLYDNIIESLTRYKNSHGFGCILAHSMGLGKTIQLIGFIDVFLRYTGAKSVLCIVPINTLQNWMTEFDTWTPDPDKIQLLSEDEGLEDVKPRSFNVYLMNDTLKNMKSRSKLIAEWHEFGGVLLMGYEMYRLLTSKKLNIPTPKKKKLNKVASGVPGVIDIEEEDTHRSIQTALHKALVNPGPDMIVCDEGHRIKNSLTGISQSLKNIKTRRRIVLTGYPLQNNLIEYWCMVDFVRPNFLGTKSEFCNMFERPIMNGQCADSTSQDVKLMRYRAHVLHSLLEGFVQRRGHTVLQAALPPKQEYVFLIRMSPIQRKLYKAFMDCIQQPGYHAWASSNPLKAFSVCCKIWNHPDVLYKTMAQKKLAEAEDDLDIPVEGDGKVEVLPNVTKKKKSRQKKQKSRSNTPTGLAGDSPLSALDRRLDTVITYEWAEDILKDYKPGVMLHGGKITIMYSLVEETLRNMEKILVFSQSLLTLDLIEEFLSKLDVPLPHLQEKWSKNKTYFRLDGSTSATERERLINIFNSPENDRIHLFLLSTRAGCLGVNLVGANRVIVMDASWNPCHDCQAVCRVYRFGQDRFSYIYRLVTDNTLEKKIYDRQISKQGMSDRVVDELQPANQFTRKQVDNLLDYEDQDLPEIDINDALDKCEDPVLTSVLLNHFKWLTKTPFTHESLLIDKKELRLTKREKKLAKQSYIMEKKMSINYSRPAYPNFVPRMPGPPRVIRPMYRPLYPYRNPLPAHRRPVASVRPMMSTPVPMQPRVGSGPGSHGIPTTLLRPGVSVHQVLTTTEILLPGTTTVTNTQPGSTPQPSPVNRIPAGEQVLVIKTPKGVYIRSKEGKIFAVRSRQGQSVLKGKNAEIDKTSPGVSQSGISSATAVSPSTTAVSSSAGSGTTSTNSPSSFTKDNPLLLSQLQAKEITDEDSQGKEILSSIYSQNQSVADLLSKSDSKDGSSDQGEEMYMVSDVVKQNLGSGGSAIEKLQTFVKSKETGQNPLNIITPNTEEQCFSLQRSEQSGSGSGSQSPSATTQSKSWPSGNPLMTSQMFPSLPHGNVGFPNMWNYPPMMPNYPLPNSSVSHRSSSPESPENSSNSSDFSDIFDSLQNNSDNRKSPSTLPVSTSATSSSQNFPMMPMGGMPPPIYGMPYSPYPYGIPPPIYYPPHGQMMAPMPPYMPQMAQSNMMSMPGMMSTSPSGKKTLQKSVQKQEKSASKAEASVSIPSPVKDSTLTVAPTSTSTENSGD